MPVSSSSAKKDIISVKPEDAGKHLPATLEGCVVRMADRISYLGRDYEDAIMAGFLGKELISYHEEIGLGATNSQIIGTLIDDIVPVKERIGRIIREADEILKQWGVSEKLDLT